MECLLGLFVVFMYIYKYFYKDMFIQVYIDFFKMLICGMWVLFV